MLQLRREKNNQIRDVLCGVLNAAYIISYWAAYANSVDLSTPVSSTLSTCRHVHFITIRQDGPRETTRRQSKQEGKGKLHHRTTKPVEKKINKATFKVNSPADGYADSVKGSNHKKKLNNKKEEEEVWKKSVRVSSGQGPGLNESSFGLCLLAAAVG